MKTNGKHLLPATLISLLTTLAVAAGLGWVVVPSPNPSEFNLLGTIAPVSASDIWAVGYEENDSVQLNLAEHWNGATWAVVNTPSPGSTVCGVGYENQIFGAAAISTNDVWTVGYYCAGQPGEEQNLTLAEHWDGTQWTVIPTPNPSVVSYLFGLAALATDNVWAVGQDYGESSGPETLIEHWDGSSWSIVPSPTPQGRTAYLAAVAAISPTDIWTVGYSGSCCPSPNTISLIEHYDGNSWSIVSSPNAQNSQQNELNSVVALASDNVWAVGYQNSDGNGQSGEGLIQHWDGTQWSLVSTPVLNAPTYFNGIAARSSTNIWAVGYHADQNFNAVPLTEQWNGSTWTVISTPNPGLIAQLYGATSVGNQVWAVGAFGSESGLYVGDPSTFVLKSQSNITAPPK